MEIIKKDHAFVIEDEHGKIIASISYQVESDDVIVANSTFVDPVLRGQGIARKLLDRLAEHARENNLKIRPLCSYVVNAFEKYDDYQDVQLEK